MGLLFFLWLGIIGFFVGALGRFIVPGRNKMSVTLTIVLGLAGSWLGGLIGQVLFGDGGGILLAIVVAGALVWLVDANRSKPPTSSTD